MGQAVLTPQLLSDVGWEHTPMVRLLVLTLLGDVHPQSGGDGWQGGQAFGGQKNKSMLCWQFKIKEVLI